MKLDEAEVWNKLLWGGLAIIGVGLTIWYICRDQQQQFIQPQQQSIETPNLYLTSELDDLWKCKECGRQTNMVMYPQRTNNI